MNDQTDQETNQQVDINSFAEMVGFPAELIKKELFQSNINQDQITIDELRAAMLKYIDSAMINNK